MGELETFMKETLEVGKIARGSFSLMGCDIDQLSDYSITLSQDKILREIDASVLVDAAGLKIDYAATNKQATVYRHIIGRMLFIVGISSPFMLLQASIVASKIADLRCHHLRALEDLAS